MATGSTHAWIAGAIASTAAGIPGMSLAGRRLSDVCSNA
jgi:hypothetical protein